MNKIKELRLKNHFSQDEMAETLHISQNAYSLIENGKTRLVDMERINLIAEKFGVNPLELGLFETHGVTQNFNGKVENNYAAYIATLNTYNNKLVESMAAQLDFKNKHIEDLTTQNSQLMQMLAEKK